MAITVPKTQRRVDIELSVEGTPKMFKRPQRRVYPTGNRHTVRPWMQAPCQRSSCTQSAEKKAAVVKPNFSANARESHTFPLKEKKKSHTIVYGTGHKSTRRRVKLTNQRTSTAEDRAWLVDLAGGTPKAHRGRLQQAMKKFVRRPSTEVVNI